MVYFANPQTYLEQSTLLLQARPTTTRITTRYSLARPPPDASAAQARPRGALVLKTYDPVSGTCLKYRTNKAAEVGRLVAGLGRCARHMAAAPPAEGEDEMGDGDDKAEADDKGAAATVVAAVAAAAEAVAGAAGGGGGKKKKKAKR